MNSKIILQAQFGFTDRLIKTIGTSLLTLLICNIVYGSESESSLKSCMTVRTLEDSLSESQPSREHAKYRRMLRKCGLRPVSASYNSLPGLIEVEDSDSLQVSFDKISLRDYPITMGDNPSVSCGPPITICWDPQDEEECDVEVYEERRGMRRTGDQLRIPSILRKNFIEKDGYTWHQILQEIKNVSKVRADRQKTASTLHSLGSEESLERYFRSQERLENCRRFASNLFAIRKLIKERKMIAQWRQFDKERVFQAGDDAQEEADYLEELIQSLNDTPETFEEDSEYDLDKTDNGENDGLEF